MSLAPDFHHYTLAELYDAADLIDRQSYPDRVAQIDQLIKLRKSEGDLVPVIPQNQTWLRFKTWLFQTAFSKWLANSLSGRIFRSIKNHTCGTLGKRGEVADRMDQWLALKLDVFFELLFVITALVIASKVFPTFKPEQQQLLVAIVGIAVSLTGFYLLNLYWLITRSQTIGKYLVGIRIETLDGVRASLFKILVMRTLLPFALTMVTLGLSQLLNLYLILSKERRSLQDHLAKTRLVYV